MVKFESDRNVPTLSVVVPITRMSGKLQNLQTTLQSAGSYPIEIILVHDVQDELTQVDLESLVANFPHVNIKLLVGKFGNPGEPRNLGVREATGDWICFWDSDDQPKVEKYFEMIASASKLKAEISVGLLRTVNESTGEFAIHDFHSKTRFTPLEFGRIPGFTRFAFKSHVVKNVKFPFATLGEDQVFLMRTNFLDRSICYFQEVVYDYIIDFPGQASANLGNRKKLFTSTKLIIKELKNRSACMTLFCYSALVRTSLATVKNNPSSILQVFGSLVKPVFEHPGLAISSLLYHLRNRNAIKREF